MLSSRKLKALQPYIDIIEKHKGKSLRDIFDEIEYTPPSKELGRHALRSGSRIVESVACLPGDILSIPKKLTASAIGRMTNNNPIKIVVII